MRSQPMNFVHTESTTLNRWSGANEEYRTQTQGFEHLFCHATVISQTIVEGEEDAGARQRPAAESEVHDLFGPGHVEAILEPLELTAECLGFQGMDAGMRVNCIADIMIVDEQKLP